MISVLRRAGVLALLAVALIAAAVPAYNHLKAEYEAYVTFCLVWGGVAGVVNMITAGADALDKRLGPPDNPDPPLKLPTGSIHDPKDWLVEVYLPDKLLEVRLMLGRIDRAERLDRQADLPFCEATP